MNPESPTGPSDAPAAAAASRPRKSPITRLLDMIGNVWFGVIMLFLILVYCWLGSAGTTPLYHWIAAQHFEKTEMEWYAWWPFTTLLAVFSLSLILVTIRRIPFTKFSLGVWTVHTGILVLVAGSVLYFGTKLEGDLLVFRHRATIRVGDGAPVTMLVRRGERVRVKIDDRREYEVTVAAFAPKYTLLTGEHKGKRTFATTFDVREYRDGEAAEGFTRQVLTGYPQFTEDVLSDVDGPPRQRRAIKVLGRRMVDEKLTIELSPAPSRTLFLVDRPALLVREVGDDRPWAEWPLEGLPRYREYLKNTDDVPAVTALLRGRTPPSLDLAPERTKAADGVPDDLSVRITGYLPYAHVVPIWRPTETAGSAEEGSYPLIRYRLGVGKASQQFELMANHPERSERSIGLFPMRFKWCKTPADVEALKKPAGRKLIVRVKGKQFDGAPTFTINFADLQAGHVTIPGTAYSVKLVNFFPDWRFASGKLKGKTGVVAIVDVKGSPKGAFQRSVVAPFKSESQDMAEGSHETGIIDGDLDLELVGGGFVGLTLVGGPAGTHAILSANSGKVLHRAGAVGEKMVFDGPKGEGPEEPISVEVTELGAGSTRFDMPVPIPIRERNPKDKTLYSLVQAEVSRGGERKSVWLAYSPYSYPSRVQGAHHGVMFRPKRVTLGGQSFELAYCRESIDLPNDVVLDEFDIEQYPGKREVRNYISRVRFADGNGGYGAQQQVSSNNPAAYDGWWYFQSTWDPPDMNYTGLGVGNRRGVLAMLLGSILIVLGTFYAFYVKPVLIRRHKERAAMKRDASSAAGRPPVVAGMLILMTAMLTGCGGGGDRVGVPLSVSKSFAESVNLDEFRLVAVQEGGRLKTIDSLAREKVKWINPRAPRSVDPVLFYLDLIFSPAHYHTADVIFIKKKHIRRDLVQGVRARVRPVDRKGLISDAELERILDTGFCSTAFLREGPVLSQLRTMSRDLLRTAKETNNLHAAMQCTSPSQLRDWMRVIPPPAGDVEDRWFPLAIASPNVMPNDAVHGGARRMSGGGDGGLGSGAPEATSLGVPGLDPAVEKKLIAQWRALETAWTEQDAGAATTALGGLSQTLASVKPDIYPESGRLAWEHWYYRNHKLTWTWIFYLGAVAFLLIAVVFRFPWSRRLGLGFFAVGFVFHTLSIILRWYLAGRIPNANMFEAIIASSWFGALIALIMEYVLRRWTLKSIPAFCAATFAMIALMVGHFAPILLPGQFSSDITTVAPLLDRTIWLYIHTNLVIASYALIFFGGVAALLYLVVRVAYEMFGAKGGAQSRIAALWLGGTGDAPVSGGAASVILSGGPKNDMSKAGLAKTLDGSTMIFMELGFISLWVGTILGAIWADVSWGRPWGWDPKEVFALNTWLIFLILIHVRLKSKDKALWTAMLAVIGCGAMLFNWIAVNFVIVGLHSYA